jgi:hypothetical protein
MGEPFSLSRGRCVKGLGHVIPDGAEYCDCNDVRVCRPEPMTYTETKEYIQEKIREGLARCETLAEILKVAVVQGFPFDDIEGFEAAIDRNEEYYRQISGHALMSKYEVCPKCHIVVDIAEMLCANCRAGKNPLENLRAKP